MRVVLPSVSKKSVPNVAPTVALASIPPSFVLADESRSPKFESPTSSPMNALKEALTIVANEEWTPLFVIALTVK